MELPDSWLGTGEVWLIPQTHRTQEVHFGGTIEEIWERGGLRINHRDYTTVLAVPYDMPVSGYRNDRVNPLRLWDAKTSCDLDMELFSKGEYVKAVEQKTMAEVISMVLYPADNHIEGQIPAPEAAVFSRVGNGAVYHEKTQGDLRHA